MTKLTYPKTGRFISKGGNFCLKCDKPLYRKTSLKIFNYRAKYCKKHGAQIRVKKYPMPVHNTPHSKETIAKLTKHGRSSYRKYLKPQEFVCFYCRSKYKVIIHHIDEDRYNNKLYNLRPLCRSCHTLVHVKNYDKLLEKVCA